MRAPTLGLLAHQASLASEAYAFARTFSRGDLYGFIHQGIES